METRYLGRIVIQDNATDLLFVIPIKKNWRVIIYTSVWLCTWLVGEIATFASMDGSSLTMMWLLAWTIGGLFVFRSLVWNFAGKELIAIDNDTLIIEKKGLLFSVPKQYDTDKARNVRIEQEKGGYVGQFVIRKDLLNTGTEGIIVFDYESQIVRFACGIDKETAKAIIQEMRQKQYLTNSHFSQNTVEAK